jgi:hypothetical protein
MIPILLSIEKCIFAYWFGATSVPSDLLYSTKSDLYFEIISATALSEPALYIPLTFQVPILISILFRLGRLSKKSVQVRGFLRIFVTILFFTVRSC